MCRQSLTIADPIEYDLIAGISQAVQGAVTQDGMVKESQPLLYCPVAGNNKAGVVMPGNNQLIKISRLLRGEPLQAEIVQDEEIGAEERTGDWLPSEFARCVGQGFRNRWLGLLDPKCAGFGSCLNGY